MSHRKRAARGRWRRERRLAQREVETWAEGRFYAFGPCGFVRWRYAHNCWPKTQKAPGQP